MIKKIFFLVLLFFSSASLVQAQETVYEAKVLSTGSNLVQAEILKDNEKKSVSFEIEDSLFFQQINLKPGDRILVSFYINDSGQQTYFLADVVRRQSLLPLLVLFLILVLLIGGWRGLGSLFGLTVSLLVVALLVVPLIADGRNPVLVVLVGSFIIVPLTFYFSHGFNKKTTIAIAGTVIALTISGFLAQGAIKATQLTGLVSEEAGFLQSADPGVYNLTGILLAGIIIGLLGVLDDVTVSQAAIVSELLAVNKNITDKELFFRAMSIGKDHVSSMVNTLILVYTGASLPLLLLFHHNPQPFLQIINYEIFTEEIVRALIGSIGLILAIPLTTVLAIKWSR
jgi:uncharacterized membrane protein